MKRFLTGLAALTLAACATPTQPYERRASTDPFTIECSSTRPKEYYESSGSIERLKRIYRASVRLDCLIDAIDEHPADHGVAPETMRLYRKVGDFRKKVQHRLFNVWTEADGQVQQVAVSDLRRIDEQEIGQVPGEITPFMVEALPNALRSFTSNAWRYADFLQAEGGSHYWLSNDPLMRHLFDRYEFHHSE